MKIHVWLAPYQQLLNLGYRLSESAMPPGHTNQAHASGKAKPRHVRITVDLNTVTNVRSKDTLEIGTPGGSLIVGLGGILLHLLGRVIVIPEDTSPLFASLVVVLGIKRCVLVTVVDLHLGTSSVVARVHAPSNVSPVLRRGDNLALSTGAVPASLLVGVGVEASGRNP